MDLLRLLDMLNQGHVPVTARTLLFHNQKFKTVSEKTLLDTKKALRKSLQTPGFFLNQKIISCIVTYIEKGFTYMPCM